MNPTFGLSLKEQTRRKYYVQFNIKHPYIYDIMEQQGVHRSVVGKVWYNQDALIMAIWTSNEEVYHKSINIINNSLIVRFCSYEELHSE